MRRVALAVLTSGVSAGRQRIARRRSRISGRHSRCSQGLGRRHSRRRSDADQRGHQHLAVDEHERGR